MEKSMKDFNLVEMYSMSNIAYLDLVGITPIFWDYNDDKNCKNFTRSFAIFEETDEFNKALEDFRANILLFNFQHSFKKVMDKSKKVKAEYTK